MALVRSLVLYTALVLGANASLAADPAAVAALRDGDMKKLNLHSKAEPVPEATLVGPGEAQTALADRKGRWVLMNFWATWCAPCRKELPALDALQAELGGDRFEVLTVATGRNAPQGIDRLFAELEIQHLPKWRDPDSALARGMGIMGLPVTVILNPDGQEVARLQGEADWNSDSAKAILTALMGGA